MKLAITALLAGYATAFTPSFSPKAKSSLNMAFENELGAQEPLGFYVSVTKLKLFFCSFLKNHYNMFGEIVHCEYSHSFFHVFKCFVKMNDKQRLSIIHKK